MNMRGRHSPHRPPGRGGGVTRRPYIQGNDRGRSVVSRRPGYRLAPEPEDDDWRKWPEVTVKLTGVPWQAGTLDLWHLLSTKGWIKTISLEENNEGNRNGEAFITFSPVPVEPFWETWEAEDRKWTGMRIEMQKKKRTFEHRSPVDSSKTYTEQQSIIATKIEFGVMYTQDQMMVMKTIDEDVTVIALNLIRRELVILFSHRDKQVRDDFKIQIPFSQLRTILVSESNEEEVSLIMSFEQPCVFYRRLLNVEMTHDGGRRWNDRKIYYRQTDITKDNPRSLPVELRKRDPIVDIGRWTTFRLVFNLKEQKEKYTEIKEALSDYNVTFKIPQTFSFCPKQQDSFWDHINDHSDKQDTHPTLSWPIRYQMDACISQGILLEENISAGFIEALLKMPEREAVLRLEYAATRKERIFDLLVILSLHVPYRSLSSSRIPQHCVLSRSATVTPSTIYISTPTVEMSNRILRQYREHADRFLRVRFTDEKREGRINSTDDDSQNSVFTRVYKCLSNGITIGGRHYEFLATGNSQFREHGAYFFASTPGVITAADIRSMMGDFSKIKTVAKWSSRLGQCFSTTRAIRGTKVKIVEIKDITHNGYTFSDGVGKISPAVASIIASEIGISSKSGQPPSVYQIRLGGIKGVLAAWPEATGHEVHIRPSQYKFAALHEGLEVIRYSSLTSVVLNRQIIAVLSALNVKDHVFIRKMVQELQQLARAMVDEETALQKLQHRIDFNQMTLTLAECVLGGFLRTRDPFVLSCLHLWRVWYHKSLKEKAGLTISEGAFVLGCVDETNRLRGHDFDLDLRKFPTRAQKIKALPQIFIQVDPLQTGEHRVIEGVCIVGRNPSLHPGDLRVVNAVNIPELHHLRDVVVFSQQGYRDIPSMCSGGDLDGDDFFVIWDEQLIPPEPDWNETPMDFQGPEPIKLKRNVDIKDVVPFFVTFMKTDKLRSIATAHQANADLFADGIRSKRCLELAELHSIAVDYPKSGVPAQMRQDLSPYRFPHFMHTKWRVADREYHSDKVLGRLYDMVKTLEFKPLINLPFDQRILDAFSDRPTTVAMLDKARDIKLEYDNAVRRIMAQHQIATEFEVWTTFVLDHARIASEYKFHEEIGRLAGALRERFQEVCYGAVKEVLAIDDETFSKNGEEVLRFVIAMYTITAEEVATWRQDQEQQDSERKSEPLISFPWLFHRELVRITRLNTKSYETATPIVLKNNTPITPRLLAENLMIPTLIRSAPRPSQEPVLIDFAADDVPKNTDNIETATGTIKHRGDLLELFQDMSFADQSQEEERDAGQGSDEMDMEKENGDVGDTEESTDQDEDEETSRSSGGGRQKSTKDGDNKKKGVAEEEESGKEEEEEEEEMVSLDEQEQTPFERLQAMHNR